MLRRLKLMNTSMAKENKADKAQVRAAQVSLTSTMHGRYNSSQLSLVLVVPWCALATIVTAICTHWHPTLCLALCLSTHLICRACAPPPLLLTPPILGTNHVRSRHDSLPSPPPYPPHPLPQLKFKQHAHAGRNYSKDIKKTRGRYEEVSRGIVDNLEMWDEELDDRRAFHSEKKAFAEYYMSDMTQMETMVKEVEETKVGKKKLTGEEGLEAYPGAVERAAEIMKRKVVARRERRQEIKDAKDERAHKNAFLKLGLATVDVVGPHRVDPGAPPASELKLHEELVGKITAKIALNTELQEAKAMREAERAELSGRFEAFKAARKDLDLNPGLDDRVTNRDLHALEQTLLGVEKSAEKWCAAYKEMRQMVEPCRLGLQHLSSKVLGIETQLRGDDEVSWVMEQVERRLRKIMQNWKGRRAARSNINAQQLRQQEEQRQQAELYERRGSVSGGGPLAAVHEDEENENEDGAMQAKLRRVFVKAEAAGISISDAFEHFDKDGDGTVNHAEFARALQELHFDLTDDERDVLVQRFDSDGSGIVSYTEFVEFVGGNRGVEAGAVGAERSAETGDGGKEGPGEGEGETKGAGGEEETDADKVGAEVVVADEDDEDTKGSAFATAGFLRSGSRLAESRMQTFSEQNTDNLRRALHRGSCRRRPSVRGADALRTLSSGKVVNMRGEAVDFELSATLGMNKLVAPPKVERLPARLGGGVRKLPADDYTSRHAHRLSVAVNDVRVAGGPQYADMPGAAAGRLREVLDIKNFISPFNLRVKRRELTPRTMFLEHHQKNGGAPPGGIGTRGMTPVVKPAGGDGSATGKAGSSSKGTGGATAASGGTTGLLQMMILMDKDMGMGTGHHEHHGHHGDGSSDEGSSSEEEEQGGGVGGGRGRGMSAVGLRGGSRGSGTRGGGTRGGGTRGGGTAGGRGGGDGEEVEVYREADAEVRQSAKDRRKLKSQALARVDKVRKGEMRKLRSIRRREQGEDAGGSGRPHSGGSQ